MNLQELQAKLEAKKTEVAAKVANNIAVTKIQAQLNMLENDNLTLARVKASLRQETSDKLTNLNTQCEQLVATMPIYNAKTKQDRKWNPSRQYGLGNQIATLTGILSGIQYSATAHKEQLLALTGLSEDVIEATLEAFGSPSYYSNNYAMVVDEVPYNLDEILNNIGLIEQALNIVVDKSKLTETTMRTRFTVARTTAERTATQTATTVALSNQLISID